MGHSATQVVMGITGAVVGAVVGGPWGAAAGFAIGYGAGELLMSMLPDVKTSDQSSAPSDYTLRSSQAANRYILGEIATGGVLTWAQEQAGSQTDDEWLHMIYYLSQGEISSVENIYINDEDISNYSGYISYEVVKMPTTVNTFLLNNCADYKETMIGYGLSYIRVSYKYNTDKYSSGIPSAQFIVKGRTDIYDPRTQTSSYSNNSALCILWYMMHIMGIPADEIIMDTFIEAANICDEEVTNADGSISKRYTLGAVIGDDESKVSVLSKLLKTCAGQLNRVGGYWMLQVGAYYGPYDYTITEDMIIGSTEIQTEVDNDSAINIITGTFVDPNSTWATTDYPSVANDIWIAEDGGETSEDLSLEYVTDAYQAQRLAWIALKARRNEGGISTTLDYNGYNCRIGRVVRIFLPSFNIDGEFIVNNWSLSKDNGCQVSFSRYSADIYDDTVGTTYIPTPIIQITANGINPPSNLLWSPYSGSENQQGTLTWTAPNASVEYYGVLVRNEANTLIQSYQVDGNTTVCNIGGLSAGNYTFSVYARAALRKSGEATISVAIEAPTIPTSVSYTNSIDSITLTPFSLEGLNGGTYRYYFSLSAVTSPKEEATLLGTGASFTHQSLSFNTGYHYYIQAINAYGESGFFHILAYTSNDVSSLLSALSGQITKSELAQDLVTPIDSIATLSDAVDALTQNIDSLLGAPNYDVNEASVTTGEYRVYTDSHIYLALQDMSAPIPDPTNTVYWADKGLFTSITDTLTNISASIANLELVSNGQAKSLIALKSLADEIDNNSLLDSALNHYSSLSKYTEEVTTRANEDSALSQRINTLETQVGNNLANVIETISAEVNVINEEVTAVTNDVTSLTSTVNDNTASIQTNAQTLASTNSGLSASYSIRAEVDDNGVIYASGMSLGVIKQIGEDPQSQVIFLADKFAIMTDVNGNYISPFIVSDGVVYINDAMITQLTANTITVSSVIKSADNKMILDFTTPSLLITSD